MPYCSNPAWSVLLLVAGLSALVGCSSYRQNVMFKPGQDFTGKIKSPDLLKAEKNYIIQVNDYLQLEVFSNKGERIIDPNGELLKSQVVATQTENVSVEPKYLVDIAGMVNFPMIGPLKLEGLTLRQAEQALQQEYDKFYKECYVTLSFGNKRVILLGAVGGQVIPLVNENVSLVEVLALAKGIGNEGKAHNIRLLRGEYVYLLDLSTLDGVKQSNMIVQPGDVVYVEPIRRPFIEGFRDFSPIASLFLSLGTLVLVIVNLNSPN